MDEYYTMIYDRVCPLIKKLFETQDGMSAIGYLKTIHEFLLKAWGFHKANWLPCPTCGNTDNYMGYYVEALAKGDIELHCGKCYARTTLSLTPEAREEFQRLLNPDWAVREKEGSKRKDTQ